MNLLKNILMNSTFVRLWLGPKLKSWCLLVGLVFISLSGNAISGRGNLRRACAQISGTDVTVCWSPLIDACGSFKSVHIWARQDSTFSFSFLDSITDIGTLCYTHTGATSGGKNFWQYFIILHNDCNGDSTASSDTVRIDFDPPAVSEIDSVSVDPITGNVTLGWQKNTSADVAGYIIYKQYGGSQNIPILNTSATAASLSGLSPNDSAYTFFISAYDSCGIQSAGSKTHTSILLKGALDDCSGIASIDWTNYISSNWAGISNYEVWVSRNNGGFVREESVINSVLNTQVSDIKSGDSVEIIIRTSDSSDPNKTSSSNILKLKNPAVKLPKVNYLSSVGVINCEFSRINWTTDSSGEISSFKILRGLDTLKMDTIATVPFERKLYFEYDDKDAKVNLNKAPYFYRILVFDNCGNFTGSYSNISNTIRLAVYQVDDSTNRIGWNSYGTWSKGVGYYYVFRGVELNGEYVWKIAGSIPATDTSWVDENPPSEAGNTGVCYRIDAHENPGNPLIASEAVSLSNCACEIKDFTVYFPTAFNPFGINRKWIPKGSYINYEKSTVLIFDRWGQFVTTIEDLHKGWDGKDKDGEWMPPGLYHYQAIITGVKKNKKTYRGSFMYLR
jgi:gliding motility-associated-like protein